MKGERVMPGSIADEVGRRGQSNPSDPCCQDGSNKRFCRSREGRESGRAGRQQLPDFRVRALERGDRTRWEPLWRAYLVFYRAQWSDEVADATFARIFDPLEPVHALVADRSGELIGLTHYLFQRSTWLLNPQCYLQDLYTSEAARGSGVGRALIAAVAAAAKEAGAARVYWHTHESNAVARGLYDAVAVNTGFIQYRIEPLG
jgi:GNAT superfamily N-acetyltransferase